MKSVQVTILHNSRDKDTISQGLQVPADLNLALEKISDEIDIDLSKRLKLDMQLMINGEEVAIDSPAKIKLEDGDRIVFFPGIGGG